MKKYTELELKDVLEKHFLWLAEDPNGVEADLRGADLTDLDLSWYNFYGIDLRGANLYGADLREADLYGANLYGADLREADLREANLNWADLRMAKHVNCPMACPEKGSFIGFKKVCGDLIVELEITADALRSSATGRKCRCSKAKVLSITNIDGTESDIDSARSLWDPDFVYTVGETIEAPNFDTNRWNECAPGIHFFISRQEAVDFII